MIKHPQTRAERLRLKKLHEKKHRPEDAAPSEGARPDEADQEDLSS
jgi:hypothetical protein